MKDIELRIRNYFDDLNFYEPTHTYDVKGKKLPSVSGLIKKFVKFTDFDLIAQNIAEKRGVPKAQVLQEWDDVKNEACDRGHRVHLFGENYVFDRTLTPTCNQEKAVVKFWNDVPEHIVPVIMELQMFHKIFQFAGTADILMYDRKADGFIIGDYKTNKDLFKNFRGKTLKAPFDTLLDCPFSKYEIQLSFYQILLEQTGYKVVGRKLVWLLPDGTYNMYDTQDYTATLIEELKNW